MLLAVRPQTGPSLVWTVVPAVHDAAVWAVTAAACGVAEAPPTEATVSPAARAAAAPPAATARSSFIPRDDAELIIFRVIAKLLRLKYELDPPFSPVLLGWLVRLANFSTAYSASSFRLAGLSTTPKARTGRAASREPAVIRGAVAPSRQRPRPGKSCRAHRRDGAPRPGRGSTSAGCRHGAAGHTGPTTDRGSPRRSTHRSTEAAPTTRASRAPPGIAGSARRQSPALPDGCRSSRSAR